MAFQPILDTMQKLIESHDAMLLLADQKKEALRSNDIDRLNQVVHKEMQSIRQITELEKTRVEAIGQFLVSRGFYPNPNITMTELSKLVFKGEDRVALAEAQQLLLERIGLLKEKNALLQQLLQDAMAYVEFSLDLLIGKPVDEPVYQRPAAQPPATARMNLFDTRA